MAKKHRVPRARHRNSVKNKGNAKHGFKHKHHRTKPKSKYPKPHFGYTPVIIDWSAPWDGNVPACILRVENGKKCYCLEQCKCRNCDGCRHSNIVGDLDNCASACKTCPNHVPCR